MKGLLPLQKYTMRLQCLFYIASDCKKGFFPAMWSMELKTDRERFPFAFYRTSRYRHSCHSYKIRCDTENIFQIHRERIGCLLPYLKCRSGCCRERHDIDLGKCGIKFSTNNISHRTSLSIIRIGIARREYKCADENAAAHFGSETRTSRFCIHLTDRIGRD